MFQAATQINVDLTLKTQSYWKHDVPWENRELKAMILLNKPDKLLL